ncbi:MAG: OmpH family outer membrane protein [Chitinophagales bacterium]|nr:OmpH family outer membrane protein [Chitinophagales bacterium]
MKANISLALNALLLIAVIYLFTQLPGSKNIQEFTNTGTSTETAGIVYLNADSLLNNYTYFRQKMEDLQARESAASQQIGQQMAALENEFKAVQKKIQQGLLSPSQIAGEEQRLGRKQQQLLAEQEQMSQVLMVETQQLNAEFQEELIELMDQLRAEKGYDYILQYGQGSGVLSAKGSYDITNDVLKILNKRHAGEAEASVDSLGN